MLLQDCKKQESIIEPGTCSRFKIRYAENQLRMAAYPDCLMRKIRPMFASGSARLQPYFEEILLA